MISETEAREAAIFNGITWHQFQRLAYRERVDYVAYFRLRKLIQIHEDDAVSRELALRARRR